MKRKRLITAILAAVTLAGSVNAWAHEECDEPEPSRRAVAQKTQMTTPQAPVGSQVLVKLFQYQPGRIQVKAGTTVTWVNDDEIFHTVTVDSKDRSFDAPLDGKGKSFSFTFTQPGIYSYYCDRHEHMRGEIEVR
jgi:plastocyanin